MEKTDYVGTIGRIAVPAARTTRHVHGLKTGEGYITGLMLQWQDGKQVNMWPADLANGKIKFPAFIKLAVALSALAAASALAPGRRSTRRSAPA